VRASLLCGGPLSDAFSTERADGADADCSLAPCCPEVVASEGERRVYGRVAGTVSVFVCVEYLFELAYCAFLCLDAVLEVREVLLVALPVGMEFV
jgi:hypothetical protein